MKLLQLPVHVKAFQFVTVLTYGLFMKNLRSSAGERKRAGISGIDYSLALIYFCW